MDNVRSAPMASTLSPLRGAETASEQGQSRHLEGADLAAGAADSEDGAAALGGVPKGPRRQHVLACARRPCAALKVEEERLVHCRAPCATNTNAPSVSK